MRQISHIQPHQQGRSDSDSLEMKARSACREKKKRQTHPILSPVRVRHPQPSGGCLEVAHLLVLKTVRRRESYKKKEV